MSLLAKGVADVQDYIRDIQTEDRKLVKESKARMVQCLKSTSGLGTGKDRNTRHRGWIMSKPRSRERIKQHIRGYEDVVAMVHERIDLLSHLINMLQATR